MITSSIGIKLSYLLGEFCDQFREELRESTTKDICEKIIIPRTTQNQTWCEKLQSENGCHVGTANVFVSHAWDSSFQDLCETLEEHFQDSLTEVIVWIDIFSINQHEAKMKDFNWWKDMLEQTIHSINHTVLIVSNWKDPLPLKRTWCLWELYCSCSSNHSWDVLIGPNERESFLTSYFSTAGAELDSMFGYIDVRQSKCSSKQDEKEIFDEIEKVGGFPFINNLIIQRLTEWTRKTFAAEYAKALQDVQDTEPALHCPQWQKYLQYQLMYLLCHSPPAMSNNPCPHVVNHLVSKLRQNVENRKLCQCTEVEIKRAEYWLAETNRVYRLIDEDNTLYAEAESTFRSYMVIFAHNLEAIVPAASSLVKLFYQRKRLHEAQTFLDGLFTEWNEKGFNPSHPDYIHFMGVKFMLADCYFKQRINLQDAKDLLLECLRVNENIFSPFHRHMLSTQSKLAEVYEALKEYEEAKECYSICLERKRELFGDYDLSLLFYCHKLSFIAKNLNELAMAKAWFEYHHEILKIKYGPDNSRTKSSYYRLRDFCNQHFQRQPTPRPRAQRNRRNRRQSLNGETQITGS